MYLIQAVSSTEKVQNKKHNVIVKQNAFVSLFLGTSVTWNLHCSLDDRLKQVFTAEPTIFPCFVFVAFIHVKL